MTYRDRGAKVGGCLGVIVLFAGLAFLPFVLINAHPYYATFPRPFVSSSWKAAVNSTWDDDRRCGMVLDLQFGIGLKGRSRAEVTDLLGPSENERVEQRFSHWHLCPSFLDIWILEVRWENGRVADAVVRDT